MTLRNVFTIRTVTGVLAGVAVGLVATATVAAAHTDSEASRSGPQRYEFGLWGDMPYAKNDDAAGVEAVIDDMNAQHLAFTVFDGDIKDGSSLCTDDVYTAAIERFDSVAAPTVYVPGDNEWTDCHRTNNGGYDNLERLTHLRETLFAGTASFGQRTIELDHQGEPGMPYSENTRWVQGPAVFVGLNVPGSNNNKVNSDDDCTHKSERTAEQCAADNAEYTERNAKNLEWLHQSFEFATAHHAGGLMVAIQADPGFDIPVTEDVNERDNPALDGYNDLLQALIDETESFDGQVVLVHGDTHTFVVDKPLADTLDTQLPAATVLPNFTRVGTFGSPETAWVRVTVDPKSRNLFSFEPMMPQSAE